MKETNELEGKPIEHYLDGEPMVRKREESPRNIPVSTLIEMEFELIQLELLKQIKTILRAEELDYEKLGALVDTYEVLLGDVGE